MIDGEFERKGERYAADRQGKRRRMPGSGSKATSVTLKPENFEFLRAMATVERLSYGVLLDRMIEREQRRRTRKMEEAGTVQLGK